MTIDAKAGPEGGGNQTVVVTLEGIPDDSVRTERWTLGFEEAADGIYALTAAFANSGAATVAGTRSSQASLYR